MLQFYAEITQILRNLRNRYALLRRLRTVTHRYADGNLLMGPVRHVARRDASWWFEAIVVAVPP